MILWVIFSFTLLLLWDAWQRHQGQPSMFGAPPATEVSGAAPAANTAAATTASSDAAIPGVPATPADAAVPGAPTVPGAESSVTPPTAPAAISSAPELITVTTDVLRLAFDPIGAQIVRAELLEHPQSRARELPVVLFDRSAERLYTAQTGVIGNAAGTEPFPNHRSTWQLQPGPRELTGDTLELVFVAEQGAAQVRQVFTLQRGRYDIAVRHEITNQSDQSINPFLYVQLERDGNSPAGESRFYSTFTGPVLYTEQGRFQKIEFRDIERGQAEFVRTASDGWIGMIQHYFATAWIPAPELSRTFEMVRTGENLYAARILTPFGTVAPGATAVKANTLWVGPQDQSALKEIAPGLDLVVDYGWLTIFAKPLFYVLQWLHSLVNNWGWSIVLLTVLIKLMFYPLSAASYRSMAKMKAVTPRMMEIREKFGNDRQKMNVAMMELYKTEKINPLGGCLPILVQIPVFIALYWVLLASVEMRNAPWILWINDLAVPDPWFILPVIMIVTMFIQFKLNPTPPDPIQAKVMMAMPIIFGGMMVFFPAGLVLYWVVNNILSIAQQAYIMRQIERAKELEAERRSAKAI